MLKEQNENSIIKELTLKKQPEYKTWVKNSEGSHKGLLSKFICPFALQAIVQSNDDNIWDIKLDLIYGYKNLDTMPEREVHLNIIEVTQVSSKN